jgi:hypothetical protein
MIDEKDCFEEVPEFNLDSIGGYHSEGLGWNPHGLFCGECSSITCENCKWKDEFEREELDAYE